MPLFDRNGFNKKHRRCERPVGKYFCGLMTFCFFLKLDIRVSDLFHFSMNARGVNPGKQNGEEAD
jgi:hypothetical protein